MSHKAPLYNVIAILRRLQINKSCIYLLTQWSRVLEKLTGFQLFKKFLAFYGTPKFITAVTNARNLPLS
jgi:hypothetical protein